MNFKEIASVAIEIAAPTDFHCFSSFIVNFQICYLEIIETTEIDSFVRRAFHWNISVIGIRRITLVEVVITLTRLKEQQRSSPRMRCN